MRFKKTTLAALCLAFASAAAYAAAGDRYFSNPTLNKDVVIQVNKAGVTTDALKVTGSTGAVNVGGAFTGASTLTLTAGSLNIGTGESLVIKNASGVARQVVTIDGSNNTSLGGTVDGGIKFYGGTGNERGSMTVAGAWTLGNAGLTGKHIIRNGSSTASQPVLTIIKDNISQNTNSNIYMSFEAASASDDGYLQTNGSAVFTVTDVSDRRLKKNIRDATYGLDTIMALRPVLFDWKSGPQDVKGFIAQEVKSVLPESVTVIDKSVSGGFKDSHFLEMQTMIPVLVKAVQELSAENDALKFRLTALEADRKY